MEFEMRQTGEMNGTPVFESAEEAFARCICELAGVENKKEPKVVRITIPAAQEGGKPIETTIMRPCLPSPAFEICEAAETMFSEEHDIAYRIGYITGYRDKEEKKPIQTAPVTGDVPCTIQHIRNMEEKAEDVLQGPQLTTVRVQAVSVFIAALIVKRGHGYANGYWQGYNDRAGNVMPKFHYWDDPNKQAKEFNW